jgi:AGZA family xanthine/uracil permease-like MFS transporter
MLLCFLAAPLLAYVPVTATTGALVYVGIKLFPQRDVLRQFGRVDLLVLVAMQVVVVATFAIDRALLVGLLLYLALDIARRRRPDPYMVGSAALLVAGAAVQTVT